MSPGFLAIFFSCTYLSIITCIPVCNWIPIVLICMCTRLNEVIYVLKLISIYVLMTISCWWDFASEHIDWRVTLQNNQDITLPNQNWCINTVIKNFNFFIIQLNNVMAPKMNSESTCHMSGVTGGKDHNGHEFRIRLCHHIWKFFHTTLTEIYYGCYHCIIVVYPRS